MQSWKLNAVPEREQIAEEWRSRGFTCGLWIDPPGQSWVDFVHETDELVVVVEGRIPLVVESESVELGPGEGACIPAGSMHSVYNIGGTEARWYFGYAR